MTDEEACEQALRHLRLPTTFEVSARADMSYKQAAYALGHLEGGGLVEPVRRDQVRRWSIPPTTRRIDMARTITGTYGSELTPCNIFVSGGWYAVDGSVNVNHTNPSALVDGVDVETLPDNDAFTSAIPIESEAIMDDEVRR